MHVVTRVQTVALPSVVRRRQAERVLAKLRPLLEEAQADQLRVQRILDEEYQRLAVRLPALLGVSSEINEPRLPTPKGTVAATRAMIPVWKAATLNVPPPARRVNMQKLDIQLRTTRAEIIQGSDGADAGRALADKLHQQGLI